METNPDSDVLTTYEQTCGYVDGDPSTDQGGVEQHVLACWLRDGIPTDVGTEKLNHLAAYFEADVRNVDDVKRVINDCGVCYIGFNIPSNILPDDGSDPPELWEIDNRAESVGGHAVVMTGYDTRVARVISWGKQYAMTWEFFRRWTDEAYALVNNHWINATGKTPLNMTVTELEQQMLAIRQHHR